MISTSTSTGALLSFVLLGVFAFSDTLSANALINLNTISQANVGLDVNVGTNGGASTSSSEVELDADATLNVSRKTVEEKVEVDAEGAAAVEAESVSTKADLNAYAESLILSDKAVEELSFTADMVELKYRQKGRFLALLPITFTVTALAYADGRVELRYPWYSAFTIDNEEELKARARVAVDNAMRARTVGSVRAEGEVENPRFTAAESATVAGELHGVLSSAFDANSDTQ